MRARGWGRTTAGCSHVPLLHLQGVRGWTGSSFVNLSRWEVFLPPRPPPWRIPQDRVQDRQPDLEQACKKPKKGDEPKEG